MKTHFALAFLAAAVAAVAYASEPVVCTVAVGTGAATITSTPTTGSCSWPRGAVVLMACDQDVYINSTAASWGAPPASATSGNQRVNFLANMDPYPVYLDNGDQHISLLAVSAAGTCKFMTTKRRRNF